MATTSSNLSLTLPVIADTAKIVDDFNTNMNILDGRFSAVYLAVQDKSAVIITGGSITGITDLVVSDGGTGVSTLTDGGILLGSGTGAITAMAVLADGEMIVGNGTTDPVAESGATLRTSIGVAIGTNVQAYDAGLLSIAALTTAANKIIYTTAHDVYTTTSLSAYGITLIDDADAATARTTLGLVIGTNVQAYDAALTNISGLVYVSASFIKLSANDTYVVRTITETKTDLSLNAVENTALSTWAGTTNITTLGTIATGVWSGTVIDAAKGGTGVANNAANTITFTGAYTLGLTLSANTAVTLPTTGTLVNNSVATLSSLTSVGTITTGGLGTGAVIAGVTMTLGTDANFDTYYRASNVLTRLAPNTAASNKFLRMIGTGSAGQAPSWQALGTSDIPDISATYAVIAQTMYIGTTGVAINRGSAALTLAGITLTTPDIGTPSAGVLTNCSGTAASLTAGTVTTNANLTGIVTSTGNATAIANKAIAIAKLADGTDGELITWDATGVIATVAVGTVGHVLTSGGVGVAPTFQAVSATNITVADSTSATCWVGLWEAATGSQSPKSDGGLTYNASTGMLTATGLTGPLTGNVTGNTSGSSGSCTGNAATVTNATLTTALTVNTGTLTLTANAANNSVLTIGAGAVSVSGANTGDQTNISGNAATVTVDATTSDTTCFVAIFESASGSLEPQTDATLTYNADTGVLTSTFAGALTGNVTGNCSGSSGTVATITGLAPDTATTQATQASITTCANLTTVGTIIAGIWTGTTIAIANGGTGVTTGAMTGLTSILNTALYIGRDADNQIKFATDNNIIFRLNGVDGALFGSTGELDMNTASIGFTQQTATGDGTTTIDWKLGNKFYFTFGNANEVFTFTAPTNPCNLLLVLKQDGTGSRLATWPNTVMFPGGTKPTLSTGANKVDIVSFYFDGTNYFGVANLAFAVPA